MTRVSSTGPTTHRRRYQQFAFWVARRRFAKRLYNQTVEP